MDPTEIWQLIVKADEALKYATEDRQAARRDQAAGLLQRALSEAEAIGNAPLVAQARTRLDDIRGARGRDDGGPPETPAGNDIEHA